jgi:hypothetical protein
LSRIGGIPLGVSGFYSSVSLDDFTSAYQTIAQTAKNQAEQLICVTPIWCGNADEPNQIGLVLEDYRAAIRMVCGANGFPVVEGDTLVPHDAVFFLTAEVPLHPNAAGLRYFARNLAPQLDPLLR